MTKGKPIVILIPPDLRAAYEPIAAAEHRSMRNKVIDVLRSWLEERDVAIERAARFRSRPAKERTA